MRNMAIVDVNDCLEVKSILRQSRPVPSVVSSYLLSLASLMVSQSDVKLIEEVSELLITDRLIVF